MRLKKSNVIYNDISFNRSNSGDHNLDNFTCFSRIFTKESKNWYVSKMKWPPHVSNCPDFLERKIV